VPKTIRTNWTCILIYEIGNMRELYVIYEEFTMGLSWKRWLELYKFATSERHNFMFIDFQKEPAERIMKNFTDYLALGPPDDGVEDVEVYSEDGDDERDPPLVKKKARVSKKRKKSLTK